ncbi:F-box protein At3g07870-like [Rutidosis leptorrhynchoides]|uniref:F-box protein At3g07870-like n=1 Tax=Rutidosis leptorrhynchoides TaxID=125765 RepID=UPI003A9A2B6F
MEGSGCVTDSMQSKTIDDLPEDLLLDVFQRLPIKALGSCMCVKKKWRSIVKNPEFISSYTVNNSKKKQYTVFWSSPSQWELFLETERFDFYKHLILPRSIKMFDASIAVCNGVLCLAKENGTIILWNPTIRKTLTIPKPNFSKFYANTTPLGFAFDSLSNDYKIVRILFSENSQSPQVGVFKLSGNCWKLLSDTAPSSIPFGPPLPLLNGAIHWLSGSSFTSMYKFGDDRAIVGFDVNAEIFHEIKLPESLKPEGKKIQLAAYKQTSIAVCSSELRVNGEAGLELWIMKQYGNVDSWTKISLGDFVESGVGCCYIQRKKFQMLTISTDPESKEEKKIALTFEALNPRFSGTRYLEETLLLLDNTNTVTGSMDEICYQD